MRWLEADMAQTPNLAPVEVSEQDRKRRRARNYAIGGLLLFLVGLTYAITIAKIGGSVFHRTM
jgi:hypothetical protein